jgi:putrescine importer
MGRDDVLPRRIFGHLNSIKGNPVYNEWIVGVVAYLAVLTIPWKLAAEIVTFGALLAFTAVNLVALLHFWFAADPQHPRNFFVDACLPVFGAAFCFGLLLGLEKWTKYAGLAWLLVGLVYAGYRTKLFRVRPKLFDFNEA